MRLCFVALVVMGALSACATTPTLRELVGDYSILKGEILGLTLRSDHRFSTTMHGGSHQFVDEDGSVVGTATAFVQDEGSWRVDGGKLVLRPDDRAKKARVLSVEHDSHGVLLLGENLAARKFKEPNQSSEPTATADSFSMSSPAFVASSFLWVAAAHR